MKNTDVYLDLPKGVKWFQGVSINHPLGFLWHPLEGAGMYIIYIYINGFRVEHKIQMTQCFNIFIFFKKKHPITWHVVIIFLNQTPKVKEPLNRCTASEALVHPWFQIGESPRSCQRHLNTLPEQMNGVMAASCESLGERVGARGDLISGAKEPQNLPNHRVEWCDFSEIPMGKM